MLSWIFGAVQQNIVHIHTHDRAAGYLEFENARVKWLLSIYPETIPTEIYNSGKRTYRLLKMGNEEIEFSDGFTDLHTKSYEEILNGNGFGLKEAVNAIQIVHDIRHNTPIGLTGEFHPLAMKELSKHPFA